MNCVDVLAHRIHGVLHVYGPPLFLCRFETFEESAHTQHVLLGKHGCRAASSSSGLDIDSPFGKTALNKLVNDESDGAEQESERRKELHICYGSWAELCIGFSR